MNKGIRGKSVVVLVLLAGAAMVRADISDWTLRYEGDKKPEVGGSIFYSRINGGMWAGSFNLYNSKPWSVDEVVDGNFYRMSTVDQNIGGWYWIPTNQTTYQQFNSDIGYTIEIRSKLNTTDTAEFSTAMLDMDEDRYNVNDESVTRYWSVGLYKGTDGKGYAVLTGSSLSNPIEVGTDFHTYRVTVKDTTATLYVDNNPAASVTTRELNIDRLRFGDLAGPEDGDWTIDYIHMYDGGAVPPPSPVQGQVTLNNHPGDPSDTCVTVEFRPQGSGEAKTATVLLNSSGIFTVPGVALGTYNVAIKANCWLKKVVSNVVVDGPITMAPVTLTGGDLDGDNAVTSTDLSIVLGTMDQGGQ